jgi:hypothetical protein
MSRRWQCWAKRSTRATTQAAPGPECGVMSAGHLDEHGDDSVEQALPLSAVSSSAIPRALETARMAPRSWAEPQAMS